MFSSFTVGLLAGIGIGAWVYNQAYKANAGNNKNALILGASAAFGTFILIVTLLSLWR